MTSPRDYPAWIYRIAVTGWLVITFTPLIGLLLLFVVWGWKQPSQLSHLVLNTRQLTLLARSLAVALGATGVAFVLGLPAAVILSMRDLPWRRLFYGLILVPLLIPPYVMAGAWIHLLSPMGSFHAGLVRVLGAWASGITLFGPIGCAWCLGVSFFPVVAIVVAAGLSEVDTSLCDVTRLATGRWGVWRHAIWPQIWPHVLASLCLLLIFILGQYGVPSLLGVNTYPVEIFSQFSAFYEDNAAVATALPLVGLVIALILLQQRVMRCCHYVRITPSSDLRSGLRLNRFVCVGVFLLAVLFLVTTVLPFASVLAHTRRYAESGLALRASLGGIVTSLVLASIAALISTVLAWPIGHYLAGRRGWWPRVLDVLCWLPLAIPGTIVGLGWIKLSRLWPLLERWESGCLLLLCAYVGLFSAFSIRVFKATVEGADPHVAEAGALHCRHWVQRLVYLDLPMQAGGIGASLIVVFVFVLGELNATILLIPPGQETLAVTIDNFLHYGASVQVSILCLVSACVAVLAVGGMMWVSGMIRPAVIQAADGMGK